MRPRPLGALAQLPEPQLTTQHWPVCFIQMSTGVAPGMLAISSIDQGAIFLGTECLGLALAPSVIN